ncbi:MAG: hypothetical protein A3G41_05960 [Elusimicrobia bacterium RIFCSPLOWO2_12_FULL_59_9]|nr:MAG: hypothetical protein A3G41_05960 [Elusimicrobia bacterium RIFCSPLOWO2_12_FULL_59_9]
MGYGNTASGNRSLAMGAESSTGAGATSSIAIGDGAVVNDNAVSAIAIGTGANARSTNAIAIGAGAVASHANSVALGNGSVTSSANSVSVGFAGGERTIQNVAPGVLGTDAVNVDQLNAITSGTSAAIQNVERLASRGTAIAMASVQAIPNLAAGESGVGIGVGHFNGEIAIGAGFGHAITNNLTLSAGVAQSGGKIGSRIGLGFKF